MSKDNQWIVDVGQAWSLFKPWFLGFFGFFFVLVCVVVVLFVCGFLSDGAVKNSFIAIGFLMQFVALMTTLFSAFSAYHSSLVVRKAQDMEHKIKGVDLKPRLRRFDEMKFDVFIEPLTGYVLKINVREDGGLFVNNALSKPMDNIKFKWRMSEYFKSGVLGGFRSIDTNYPNIDEVSLVSFSNVTHGPDNVGVTTDVSRDVIAYVCSCLQDKRLLDESVMGRGTVKSFRDFEGVVSIVDEDFGGEDERRFRVVCDGCYFEKSNIASDDFFDSWIRNWCVDAKRDYEDVCKELYEEGSPQSRHINVRCVSLMIMLDDDFVGESYGAKRVFSKGNTPEMQEDDLVRAEGEL